jgi:hypothetical protein
MKEAEGQAVVLYESSRGLIEISYKGRGVKRQ